MSVDYDAVLGYGVIISYETFSSLVEKENYPTIDDFYEYLEANELDYDAIFLSEYCSKPDVFLGIPITTNNLDLLIKELTTVDQDFLTTWEKLFPCTAIKEIDKPEIESFVRVW